MTVVKELIRSELDGTLSFGDYTLDTKTKKDGFEFQGDIYKVKTFKEITQLGQNGMFGYESVPGTAVEHFEVSEDVISFKVSGTGDAQITLELEPDTDYIVYMNDMNARAVSATVSPLLALESCAPAKPSVLPPSRSMADSKESRVRVLGS